jgi:hypothetical protein
MREGPLLGNAERGVREVQGVQGRVCDAQAKEAGTMRWFGEDWGASVCEVSEHMKTPVGRECYRCKKGIEAGDQGIIIPGYIWHLECFVQCVVPVEKV